MDLGDGWFFTKGATSRKFLDQRMQRYRPRSTLHGHVGRLRYLEDVPKLPRLSLTEL